MKVRSRTPQFQINITDIDDGTVYIIDAQDFLQRTGGYPFKSLETSKHLSSPEGAFEVRATAKKVHAQRFKTSAKILRSDRLQTRELILDGDFDWRDIAKPGSLVDIRINSKTLMVGTVDEPGKETGITDDGKPINEVAIRGADMGKMLTRFKYYNDVYAVFADEQFRKKLMGVVNPLLLGYGVGQIPKVAPTRELIKTFWADLIVRQIRDVGFAWADGTDLSNHIEVGTAISKNLNGNYPLNIPLQNLTGSWWQILSQVANVPFNEMFVESGDRYMTLSDDQSERSLRLPGVSSLGRIEQPAAFLVVRPCPFDYDNRPSEADQDDVMPSVAFNAQTKKVTLSSGTNPSPNAPIARHRFSTLISGMTADHILHEEDIIRRNLVKTDAEVYSYFAVWPVGNILEVDDLKAFGIFKYIPRLLNKYGFNPLQWNLNGWKVQDGKSDFDQNSLLSEMADAVKRMADWNRFNDLMMSGTINIPGRDIRIGEAVFLDVMDQSERRWYYVQGVTQSFVYPQRWTTTLVLARGTPGPTGFDGEMKLANLDRISNQQQGDFSGQLTRKLG